MKDLFKVLGGALALSAVIVLVAYSAFWMWIMAFIYLGYGMSVIVYITVVATAAFLIKKFA